MSWLLFSSSFFTDTDDSPLPAADPPPSFPPIVSYRWDTYDNVLLANDDKTKRESFWQVEEFKFLTRLHYWAADTVTHGKRR